MNPYENKKKLELIEDILNNEKAGASNIARDTAFTSSEIFKLKKILFNKAKEKTQAERQIYYTMYTKIDAFNYLAILEELDRYVAKISKPKSSEKQNTEKKLASESVRRNKEVTVNKGISKERVYELLNKYIYVKDQKERYIKIYLRDKNEYDKEYQSLKYIKEAMATSNYSLKIHLLGETTTINQMNETEKKEFNSFLRTI